MSAGGAARLALLATWAFAAWAARTAIAAEPSPAELARAQSLYREAIAHVERGQYDRAMPLLEEGYRISRLPGFLFNLAQAHRLRGNCAEAVLHYRAFLSADPSAAERPEAEAQVAALEPCPARAAPAVAAALPAPGGPPAAPPPAAAAEATTSRTTGSVPDRSDAARAPPGRTKKIIGAVALGAGLLAGGGSVVSAIQARDAQKEVEAHYRDPNAVWNPRIAAIDADGRSASTRAVVLGVAAGALVVTGAVFFLLGMNDADAATGGTSLAVAPVATGGGIQLWLGRSF